jgi:hypothetical protein
MNNQYHERSTIKKNDKNKFEKLKIYIQQLNVYLKDLHQIVLLNLDLFEDYFHQIHCAMEHKKPLNRKMT